MAKPLAIADLNRNSTKSTNRYEGVLGARLPCLFRRITAEVYKCGGGPGYTVQYLGRAHE